MITINYRDPRPIYEQIQTELRRLMLTGVLPPGSRLPSVRELAGQLAINPNTIQRAYRELEADGYILSVAGKGSFVAQVDQLAEQQKKQAADAFRAAAKKLRQLGLTQAQLAQLATLHRKNAFAVDQDVARRGRFQAIHAADQRGFARAAQAVDA